MMNQKKLIAFSCLQGQFQWTVVPFRLKQALDLFQRYMDNIFKKYHNFCVYIDDKLIFSNELSKHYLDINNVLQECRKSEIILSEKETVIAQQKNKILGLEIEYGKYHLQPNILNNIQSFLSVIKDKNQLQNVFGCLIYAEAYIKKLL